jgi:hypothetical protein
VGFNCDDGETPFVRGKLDSGVQWCTSVKHSRGEWKAGEVVVINGHKAVAPAAVQHFYRLHGRKWPDRYVELAMCYFFACSASSNAAGRTRLGRLRTRRPFPVLGPCGWLAGRAIARSLQSGCYRAPQRRLSLDVCVVFPHKWTDHKYFRVSR